MSDFEEGRDRCPYDPAKGYTGLLVGMFSTLAFNQFYVSFMKIPGCIKEVTFYSAASTGQ